MATFTIRTRNSSVATAIALDDLADSAAALALGVRSAVSMISDEIENGALVAAVQLIVEEHDRIVERAVVTLSVASITLSPDDTLSG